MRSNNFRRCPHLAAHAYSNTEAWRAAMWASLCRAWLPYVPNRSKQWFLEKDPDLTAGFLNAIAPANSVVRCADVLSSM